MKAGDRGGGEESPGSRSAGVHRASSASQDVKYLPGVGPRRAELLRKLGIERPLDLLDHFPRRYEDRRKLVPISAAVVGETQVLYGELVSVRERTLRGRRSIVEARLADAARDERPILELRGSTEGVIDLLWFNQPYLLEWLRPGTRLYAYGQVRLHRGRPQMLSPEFELDTASDDPTGDPSPHVGRIVPVYPLTRGIYQRFLRGLIYRLLSSEPKLEPGPHDVAYAGGVSRLEAYRSIHFPQTWEAVQRARDRLVFDEYFTFATHLFLRRRFFRESTGQTFAVTVELDRKIRSVFPFRFTADQDKAVTQITGDLRGPRPMYRLIQGDVGTGKTAVALYAMLVAIRNGYQTALMAPTEILAEQHHRTISRYLERYPVRVGLLTGSIGPSARRSLHQDLETGKAHIVVGTHALVQDDVRFKKLGLVVIDEQHRFGVRERMRLRLKGDCPHILVMTATPIPRSLCLTSYGDLDLALLKERPEGRQPVKTILVARRDRPRAMEFIRGEIARGRQAYFVYPLIEESESLALPAARKAHETLSRDVFPECRVGLVHGRLPAAEKDRELTKFRSGFYQVLVATVVVEVGIDVPNASVLFLEDASRFGLAQLHQLRGRVGRGRFPGYCFVGFDAASGEARARLKAFASTSDGFRIAEEDLKLRGPGDYMGVRQSGRPHFVLGNPLENLEEFLRVKALTETFWSDEGNRKRWNSWLPLPQRAEAVGKAGFLGLD